MSTAKIGTLATRIGRAPNPGRDPFPPSATAKTTESETSTEREESDRTAGAFLVALKRFKGAIEWKTVFSFQLLQLVTMSTD